MRQLGPVWARLRLLTILALTIGLLFPSFPIFGVGGATGAAAANDASVNAVVNGAAGAYTINFSQTATCNGTQGCATFTVSGLQPGETETITFKLTYHVPGNQTFMDTGLTKDVTVSANGTIYTVCFNFPSEPGANTYRIEVASATHTIGTLSNPDAKSLSFSCNGSVSTATATATTRAATATSTSVPATGTATATTRAATATSTSVPATATVTTGATTATPTATTRAATATSTSVPATATATGTEMGQARIAVFKSLCESIGNQNTCNGRDTSLDGYRINFNVYEGTGTSGAQVDTIPVILGTNANGTGNVGNGSEGRTVGTATLVTGGTYTVCEVPQATKPGSPTVNLLAVPRPKASQGGSSGGSNQTLFGPNCIVVTLTPGEAELKFLDTIAAVTATPTATTGAATATSTTVPATATATTGAATATPTATTGAATATSTAVPATATATGTETGQARIAVFKSLCESIGNQNTCNGRDTSLDGYRINFNVYEGTGTSGAQVDTIPVILGTNANGTGNVGNGSEGRTVGTATLVTGGTYTVCEVPQATKPGSPTVNLLAVPRPKASQGGSSGGSNQTLFGPNCIVVTLTPGEAELKFLDTIAAVTATPTATTGAATATSTTVPATTTATRGATTATPTATTGAATATSTTVPATATATTGAATATPTVPMTATSPVSTATPNATATGTSAPTSPSMTVTTQPSGSTQTTATATTGSNASGNTNNQATGGTTTTSNSSTSTTTLVTQGAPLTGASNSQPAAANQTTQPVTAPTRISEAQPLTGGPSMRNDSRVTEAQPLTGGPSMRNDSRVTEAQPLTGGPSVRNDYRVTEAQPLTGGFVPGLPRTGGGYASHRWTMVAGALVLITSAMLLLILKADDFRHLLWPHPRG